MLIRASGGFVILKKEEREKFPWLEPFILLQLCFFSFSGVALLFVCSIAIAFLFLFFNLAFVSFLFSLVAAALQRVARGDLFFFHGFAPQRRAGGKILDLPASPPLRLKFL